MQVHRCAAALIVTRVLLQRKRRLTLLILALHVPPPRLTIDRRLQPVAQRAGGGAGRYRQQGLGWVGRRAAGVGASSCNSRRLYSGTNAAPPHIPSWSQPQPITANPCSSVGAALAPQPKPIPAKPQRRLRAPVSPRRPRRPARTSPARRARPQTSACPPGTARPPAAAQGTHETETHVSAAAVSRSAPHAALPS